jgi:hypothetical protein
MNAGMGKQQLQDIVQSSHMELEGCLGVVEYICNARVHPRFFDGFLGHEVLRVAASVESGRCEPQKYWFPTQLHSKVLCTPIRRKTGDKIRVSYQGW